MGCSGVDIPSACPLTSSNSWFLQCGYLEEVPAELSDQRYWLWELENMLSREDPETMSMLMSYPDARYTARIMSLYESEFWDLRAEAPRLERLRSACYNIAKQRLPYCDRKMMAMMNWILRILHKWTLKIDISTLDTLDAAIMFDLLLDWGLLSDDQAITLPPLEMTSDNPENDYQITELAEWYEMDRSQSLKAVLSVIKRIGAPDWSRHKLHLIEQTKDKKNELRYVEVPGINIHGLEVVLDVWKNTATFTSDQISEIRYMQECITNAIGCRLYDYGSAFTKLTDNVSDWDCMFLLPQFVHTEIGSKIAKMPGPLYEYQLQNLSNKHSIFAKQVASSACNGLGPWLTMNTPLGEKNRYEITCIARARKPRIVIKSRQSNVELDICISQGLDPVCNSALLLNYTLMDPRVEPLIRFVKSWSKSRRINGTFEGNFSSYGFTLTCIVYLIRIGVIENIQMPTATANFHKIKRQFDVDDECLCEDPDMVQNHYSELPWAKFESHNTDSLEKLIIGYFDFIVWEVDWDSVVLSCRVAPLFLNKIDWACSAAKKLEYHEEPDLRKTKKSEIIPFTKWPESDWLKNYLKPRSIAPEDWLYNHPNHNLHAYFSSRPLEDSLRMCCIECPTENLRILQCHNATQAWSFRMEYFRAWIHLKGCGKIGEVLRQFPTSSGGQQSRNVRPWIWQQVHYDWPTLKPSVAVRKVSSELIRAEHDCSSECGPLRKFIQGGDPSVAQYGQQMLAQEKADEARRKKKLILETKAVNAQNIINDLKAVGVEAPEHLLIDIKEFEAFQAECEAKDRENQISDSDREAESINWPHQKQSHDQSTRLKNRKQKNPIYNVNLRVDSHSSVESIEIRSAGGEIIPQKKQLSSTKPSRKEMENRPERGEIPPQRNQKNRSKFQAPNDMKSIPRRKPPRRLSSHSSESEIIHPSPPLSSPLSSDEASDSAESAGMNHRRVRKFDDKERALWQLETLITDCGKINLEKLEAFTYLLRKMKGHENQVAIRVTGEEELDHNRRRVILIMEDFSYSKQRYSSRKQKNRN